VAETLFDRGLCLPSGSGISQEVLSRVGQIKLFGQIKLWANNAIWANNTIPIYRLMPLWAEEIEIL
jgi:hypothetical protein